MGWLNAVMLGLWSVAVQALGICRPFVHAAQAGPGACTRKWPECIAHCWQPTAGTQRTCFAVEPDMLAGVLRPWVMAHSLTDIRLQYILRCSVSSSDERAYAVTYLGCVGDT